MPESKTAFGFPCAKRWSRIEKSTHGSITVAVPSRRPAAQTTERQLCLTKKPNTAGLSRIGMLAVKNRSLTLAQDMNQVAATAKNSQHNRTKYFLPLQNAGLTQKPPVNRQLCRRSIRSLGAISVPGSVIYPSLR